tara:strand:+ start:993 stop:1781 length:789 start_codon:yes stop_codon:yes gene_type:complete
MAVVEDMNQNVDLSTLKFRISTIAVPEGKMDHETSDYFNDSNILAVNGYGSSKIHFCYLLGEIPNGNVPDPNKHIVYEWHYNSLDEDEIEDFAILPKAVPPKTHGFAMIALGQVASRPTPGSPTLASGNFPEQNPGKGLYTGTEDGGISIAADGQVEVISAGKSVSFNSSESTQNAVDFGDAQSIGTKDGQTNWLLMKNPFRDGGAMGAPMPNVLPVFPLAYDPFPNIPAIVEMYLRIKMYKELFEGIGELGVELKQLKEMF